MSNESKSSKDLAAGMYNCTVIKTKEEKIYHSSTAQTLRDKGIVKVGTKVKEYRPKTMKE